MKEIVTLIFFWVLACHSWAQQDTATLSTERQSLAEGLDLLDADDYSQSRTYFLKACKEVRSPEDLQKIHRYLGVSYYMEGAALYKAGCYQHSYDRFERALEWFQSVGDKDLQIKTCRYMAELNTYAFARYRKALRLRQCAYELAVEKKDGVGQVQLLMDMAKDHEYLGAWEERISCYARIDSIVRTSDNPDLGFHVDMLLGDEARRSGRYEEAETFFTRALGKVRIDGQTPYLAYVGLRDVAMEQQDYTKAYARSQDCMREYQKIFKGQPLQQYYAYIMHGEICARTKNREECFRCADSLFQAQQYGLGESGVAQLYLYRGMWHASFEEYAAALGDYEKSLDILNRLELKDVIDTKKSVLGLEGGALSNMERYGEAVVKCKQYLELTRFVYGAKSTEYAAALEHLAHVEGLDGQLEAGACHYEQSAAIKMARARSDLKLMPTSVRQGHWETLSTTMWKMAAYGLSCGFQQNEFTGKAYDALLFSKGLLLASEKSMESEISALNDSILQEEYFRLLALRKKMTDAEAQGDEKAAARYFEELSQLDRHMTLEMAQHNKRVLLEEVGFKELAGVLGKGEVIVDFTDFDRKGKHEYVAYVLAKGWKYPKLVPVVCQEKLDSLLATVNGCIDRLYESAPSAALMDWLWEPLAGALPDAKTIYYIPSGLLHQIDFASIQSSPSEILGQRYDFVRLSSAKEVPGYQTHRKLKKLKSAVLYGGLEYDMDRQEMITQSSEYDLSSCMAVRGPSRIEGGQSFKKLYYSEAEVIAIEKILTLKNIEVHTFTGKKGTEESFLSMTGQAPDLLQISTHGFFYMPEEKNKSAVLSGYKDIMYLTGLVLSGGNSEWAGEELPEGVRGGLLTSDDISKLDLSNTQLVVLSACETGRGKVTNEGLYGLQRAFKKAGVQTLLLSLWQVSDRATKDFMVAFYTHLSKNGWDKRDAFRKAKREMRKKYEEPAYWAGFVMID